MSIQVRQTGATVELVKTHQEIGSSVFSMTPEQAINLFSNARRGEIDSYIRLALQAGASVRKTEIFKLEERLKQLKELDAIPTHKLDVPENPPTVRTGTNKKE
jgi:hypothetical protein